MALFNYAVYWKGRVIAQFAALGDTEALAHVERHFQNYDRVVNLDLNYTLS